MFSLLTALFLSEAISDYLNCDEELDISYKVVTKTLEKGKSYCVRRSFLLQSDKPVLVTTHYYHPDTNEMQISPFYVKTVGDSSLQCNYCEVTLFGYDVYGDTGSLNFVIINHDNLTLEFDLKPQEDYAHLAIFNSYAPEIVHDHQDKLSDYVYRVHDLNIAQERHLNVKITTKPQNNKLIPFGLGKFLGRIPKNGRAFKAEDLIKEYENPGTVTQENSKQGLPLKSEPDLSNGPKPNDAEMKSFKETTGYKCDDFIVPGPLEILYLEKGKSYCSNKPYYLVADKPFQVREKHYVGGQSSKISASKIYQSPFYVGSEFSEITCDNCYIHYGAASSSDVNFFAMKQKDLTFTFALPANQKSFSVTSFNPTPIFANYSFNGNDFKEFSKNEDIIYTQDLEENKLGHQIDIQIKENRDALHRPREDSVLDFPEFVGRVPMRGNIFSVDDLKSEFLAPGTINQHNSQLRKGKIDPSGTGEINRVNNELQKLNNQYKTHCDDLVVFDEITKLITIPQNKSYCITSPAVIGSKQKVEVTVFDKSGKSSTFFNPEYVAGSFSNLKCTDSSDCKVQFYFPYISSGEKSSSFLVLSKTEAEIPIILQKTGSHSAVLNYLSQKITNMRIKHNGEPVSEQYSETHGRHFFQLIDESQISNYTISFSSKVTFASDDDWILPELVGRVPTDGTAFVAKDLEKEYESPGTVKQENSEVEVKHSPTPQPKKGLGAGPIAAIVIVVILVVAAACAAVYFFVFGKRSEKLSDDLNKE